MNSKNIAQIKSSIPPDVTLVVVSKHRSNNEIMEAYNAGQRIFGENRVQELMQKQSLLPADIQWHLIGHLQTNKVKYIASFINLIHSVDSHELLVEINKRAKNNNRIIPCLLQVHIAMEERKYGFQYDELKNYLLSDNISSLKHVQINGLMGMATFTDDNDMISEEFRKLLAFYSEMKDLLNSNTFNTLSMGMSGDYKIAIKQGSNMIRIGTAIFS